MAKQTTQVVLGEGVLTWPSRERQVNRYGLVVLQRDYSDWEFSPVEGSEEATTDFADAPLGEEGQLVVEVIEGRASSHIGDFFRGMYPGEPPKKGARVVLGAGRLFTEEAWEGVQGVGVQPHDRRDTDWLNPRYLYAVHDSVVRLIFETEV